MTDITHLIARSILLATSILIPTKRYRSDHCIYIFHQQAACGSPAIQRSTDTASISSLSGEGNSWLKPLLLNDGEFNLNPSCIGLDSARCWLPRHIQDFGLLAANELPLISGSLLALIFPLAIPLPAPWIGVMLLYLHCV